MKKTIEVQSRFKSPYVWLSFLAVLTFILGNYGLYDYIGLTEDSLKTFVNLIMTAMISIGVLNNPSDAENV
jgi:uncharacterized membrane protein